MREYIERRCFITQEKGLSYGLAPFWFWNGDMDDGEIARQIDEFRRKGIGGFFIHPRQGLSIPYLSDLWFGKVALAAELAKKSGLDVWIYDEYPYPSGISGGQVILGHPEFEARALRPFQADVNGEEETVMDLPWGNVMLAAAYPLKDGRPQWGSPTDLSSSIGICRREKIFQLTGLTAYNRKRFFEGDPFKRLQVTLGPGRYRIFVFVETVFDHMKFFGRFVDPLAPGAVEYFIETTHEQYKKHIGNEFGKTVRGFFSDEIDLAPPNEKIRWSKYLPELFEERYGYSIVPWLPALLTPMGEGTQRFRYDLKHLMTERFINEYDRRIQRWCSENGLLYACEKPVQRSSEFRFTDIPGCDAGHQKIFAQPLIADKNYRANPKIVSSAAHFYSKPRTLCECFHSVGWGMNIQDMKWMIDWLVIHGVNFFTPHAFYYTTDALTKHDAPPSSFYQQPYWSDMGILSQYVKNLCRLTAESRRKVDILLLDPVTSQWTETAENEKLGERLSEEFSDIQKELMRAHFDYYIVDPELLGEFTAQGGTLRRKGETYRLLILPPMTNLEDEAAECVAGFIENGARVLSAVRLPDEIIDNGNGCGKLRRLFACAQIPEGRPETAEKNTAAFLPDIGMLPQYLEKQGLRDFSLATDGRENGEVLGAHFDAENKEYYFVANTSSDKQRLSFAPAAVPPCRVSEISPENNNEAKESFNILNGFARFSFDMAPFESKLFCMEKIQPCEEMPAARSRGEESGAGVIRIDAKEKMRVSFAGKNAVRLARWELCAQPLGGTAPANFAPASLAAVDCAPVINQVTDAKIPLPLSTGDYFGCPKELRFPELECRYAASFFSCGGAGPVYLVMEPGGIAGDWSIELNGQALTEDSFERKKFYSETNLAADVTDFIKAGENRVVVYVKTHSKDDGLLNPLYIFGDFGVRGGPNGRLETFAAPSEGSIANISGEGFPFYAGEFIFSKEIYIGAKAKQLVRLENYTGCDCASLYLNGRLAGTRAFSPFEFAAGSDIVSAGANKLEIHIKTTLLGLFEGQKFSAAQGKYIPV
jgi:hypothetical protein